MQKIKEKQLVKGESWLCVKKRKKEKYLKAFK